MKPRLLLVASALCSIAVIAACGGASESELFGSPETNQLGTDPSGETSSGTSTSSGGSSDAGNTSSSSSSSSGSPGSTSSSSSGGTSDAGSDAGPNPNTKSVWCGEAQNGDDIYCGSSQICCAKQVGYDVRVACEATGGGSCSGGVTIACDDQTDCASGQVCCGSFIEGNGYTSVKCASSCKDTTGVRAVRFCDLSAKVDECKAIGEQCESSQILPGYGICI